MADLRNFGAFRLTPASMWQAISHPSIPIASIHAIGERVNMVGGEDARKIGAALSGHVPLIGKA